jgi:hypothetical protein
MPYKPTGRPAGRPKTKYYETLQARVPQELVDRVKTYARQHQQSIAALIRDGLEWRIQAENVQRQRAGKSANGKAGGRGKKNPTQNLSKVSESDRNVRSTAAQVGAAVGMSRETCAKAKAVVKKAREDPERYGDLLKKMDTTDKVDDAFETMQRREATDAREGKPSRPW